MKIFLTGSTGFVGKRILQDLLENNYQVRCLARKGSEQKISHYKNPVLVKTGIDIVNGDITDAASLDGKLEGCDAVINLVGIIREFSGKGITFEKLHYEGTANLVKAAWSQKVRRFIQMSALGGTTGRKDPISTNQVSCRRCIRTSGLDYTIFRPSIIFGPGDKFVNLFANMLKIQQFVPVVGNGGIRCNP